MKYLITVTLLITLYSCNKDKNNSMGGTSYLFANRSSDYLSIKNAYRVDVGKETGESKFDETYYIKEVSQEDVKFSDYVLLMNTSSYTTEMTQQPDFNIENYIGEPDVEIEQQLNIYYNSQKSSILKSSAPETDLVTIEYRTEELKALKVTSDKTLFEIPAGESLNNFIEINTGSMLFDYSKQLIGELKSGTSIMKYLSYRPLVSAYMELRFKSIPGELPVDAKIIIKMELENGKILNDTSDIVHLTL